MRGLPVIPLHPKHPERVCWGCDEYCPADELTCGNGTERTPHPAELFGDDWYEWAHPEAAEHAAALKVAIVESLRSVMDPELGVNVVDLGLVYEVVVEANGSARVSMSMTTPACPLVQLILCAAHQRVVEIPGLTAVRIDPVWEPRWTPERMSDAARQALGMAV